MRRLLALALLLAACGGGKPQFQTTPKTENQPGLPPGERTTTSWESGVSVPDAAKEAGEPWHSLAPGLPGQQPSVCLSFRSTPDNKAECERHCETQKNQGLSPCTCAAGTCPR
jgi:hypothetical protein